MTRQLLFPLAMIAAVAACSSAEDAICEAMVDCEQRSDADLEVCLIQADANEDIADEKGCIDLYDDAMECFEDQGSCHADHVYRYGIDCYDLFDRLNVCVGEVVEITFDRPNEGTGGVGASPPEGGSGGST